MNKKTYIAVWIDEEQKWYYFIGSFNPAQFKDGYAAYYTTVEDGVIIEDTYNTARMGSRFDEVYNTALWEDAK